MNSAPNQVTPAPHGPLATPGTYTIKLIVDGTTYTQTVVVHNDPRIGESAAMMSALRAQNKLAMAAWVGMKNSFEVNEEVGALRSQLVAMTGGSLPPDVDSPGAQMPGKRGDSLPPEVVAAAKALDTKLAALGGAVPRGGRGGGFGGPARTPGSVLPFYAVNGIYNTVLGPLSQNGIDMPPTKAAIDAWESGCREYTASAGTWKTIFSVDLVDFNSLLTKNNLAPLKFTPTAATVPSSCTFVWPKSAGGK